MHMRLLVRARGKLQKLLQLLLMPVVSVRRCRPGARAAYSEPSWSVIVDGAPRATATVCLSHHRLLRRAQKIPVKALSLPDVLVRTRTTSGLQRAGRRRDGKD